MANTKGVHRTSRKVLFARVGWMRFYAGPVPGDERPIGGEKYNKTGVGHEVYNFRVSGQRLYGYFQPSMAAHSIALERIDPDAIDKAKLDDVLVVFVARRPEGGQVIVGWYRNAEVLRKQAGHSPGKPPKHGHFCSATKGDCVLLPDENRKFEIPSGSGGMGQANVCYPFETNGTPKASSWMQKALLFIDDYAASDILDNPEADAEEESAAAATKALARSRGQGFARTPKERRALENHAMKAATKRFRNDGFAITDVSAHRSYDLLCKKGAKELHVEVKGTTTDGDAIVLTYNEVKHACDPRTSCALFILHSIKLSGQKASGGKQRIINPWKLEEEQLKPVCYTYRLDG